MLGLPGARPRLRRPEARDVAVTSRRARRGDQRHPRQSPCPRGGPRRDRRGGRRRDRRRRRHGARALAGRGRRPSRRARGALSFAETPIARSSSGATATGRSRRGAPIGSASVVSRSPGLAADRRAGGGRSRGVLVCHSTPTADDPDLHADHAGRELVDILGPVAADVLVFGHTHMQYDRTLASGLRVVNPGSVGMPYEGASGRVLGASRAGRRVSSHGVRRRSGRGGHRGDGRSRSTRGCSSSSSSRPTPRSTTEYFESHRGA